MSAITINLVIEQGTDFSATFTIKNSDGASVNLLGFTAEAKLKTSYYTSSAATPFAVTFADRSKGVIKITLTDDSGGNAIEFALRLKKKNSIKMILFQSIHNQ